MKQNEWVDQTGAILLDIRVPKTHASFDIKRASS